MAQTATLYRRESENTRPRGFGYPPSYHFEVPTGSDAELVWWEPVTITIPDGYEVAESASGYKFLYDPEGQVRFIVDDHGHPALVTGLGVNKAGIAFFQYTRLDRVE